MGEAIVPCEFVEALKDPDLTVAVASSKGPLDGVIVKVVDSKGKKYQSASTAKFNGLAPGDCQIETVLSAEQGVAYEPGSHKTIIVKDAPRAVLIRLSSKGDELTPTIRSDRTRAVLEGREKKPAAVKFELQVDCGNPRVLETTRYTLQRSRAGIDVFQDEQCKKPLAFAGDKASLEAFSVRLNKREFVPLWARPGDAAPFALTFTVGKAAVPPVKVEFENALEFLEGPSRFLQLIDGFNSVDEIVRGFKRIKSLSALADMKAEELANFAIKRLFIRKGVLEQPVVVEIDGRKVELKHPLTEGKLPLHYSDFIIDRSGPKFLGALDADVAVEALIYKDASISTLLTELVADGKAQSFGPNLIHLVRDQSLRRQKELRQKAPGDYAEVTPSERDAATSIFEQKHMAQRRLSDFDLTARETETLSRAVGVELNKILKTQLPEPLVLEVGRLMWSQGGPIESAKVKRALDEAGGDGANAAVKYGEIVARDKRYVPEKACNKTGYKGTPYYHVLIQEVGAIACKLLERSEPHVDCGYGLGIPYMGPEVAEHEGKFEFHEKLEEIGDIITDETSHYGTVFSHNANILRALDKLKRAGVQWSFDGFDKAKNLRDNCRDLLKKSGKAEIQKEYAEREAFIDTMLMFEQVAKKEAQAQLFKAKKNVEKLMGNVSDVSQFLLGAEIAARVAASEGKADVEKRLRALREVVMLSCLIAFPRWGIDGDNIAQVEDTAGQISAAQFAESINKRSYGHKDDYDSPRVHVEWAKIDEQIAGQRLADFKSCMGPIWKFLQGERAHFQKMKALIDAIREKKDPRPARDAVRAELAKILPRLTNLADQIENRDALLDALAAQAVESAQFQVTRTRPA